MTEFDLISQLASTSSSGAIAAVAVWLIVKRLGAIQTELKDMGVTQAELKTKVTVIETKHAATDETLVGIRTDLTNMRQANG